MISFALVVLETVEDAAQVTSAGIFNFPDENAECTNCGMVIGSIPNDNFLPCAVIVDNTAEDEDNAWPICIDCAAPLIFPGDWLIEFDD